MSPRWNPDIFPAIFEANVGAHREMIDQLRADATRSGRLFDPNDYEQVFLGLRQDDMTPDWLPRSALLEHALIWGNPGAGKTARLAALIAQLIRSCSCSVVIIDSKGEWPLFQGVREECCYAGLPFRWVTNRVGLGSFAYNPLSQSHIPWRSINERIYPLLKALGLDYGEAYGGSWYQSNMQLFLNNLLTYYGKSIYSFLDLARFCSDPNLYTRGEQRLGTKEDWSNARHIHNDIFRLAAVEPLNVKRDSKRYPPQVFQQAIDADQVFSVPQVVYFNLSSIGDDTTSRNIAKLMLYGLLDVADMIGNARARGVAVKSVPVFYVVDEFAPLISPTFLPALAMARSLGLGCILHQLSLGDKDLTDTVLANVAFKHAISSADLRTTDYIVRTSGEIDERQLRWQQAIPKGHDRIPQGWLSPRYAVGSEVPFADPVVNVQSSRRPRLTADDVMRLSADKYSSMRSFVSDKGLVKDDGRWVPIWSGYHVDKETYERRRAEAFPENVEGTLRVGPFSEFDLRYRRQAPAPPPIQPGPGGAPLSPMEIVNEIRGNQ